MSYRSLLNVPSIGRLLLGMQIAKICQSMVGVATVLFALEAYHSPRIVGLATFFAIFPGLVLSPIAGALLDRHGRTRLVILDYVVALTILGLIGVLALLGALPAWLLMLLSALASLTAPLSMTGLRSLFPLLIPKDLWERANAIDSVGYVVATIIGPPLVAGVIVTAGAPVAFILIGLGYGLAAIAIARTPDPKSSLSRNRSVFRDAWEGLVYTFRNRSLRGLGFSISTLNLGEGAVTVLLPLILLQRLKLGETSVGWAFAVQGVAGMISAVCFGWVKTEGRERMMLALPLVCNAAFVLAWLFSPNLTVILLVMVVRGLCTGPVDIALFTLRQRRTPAEWTGRAFAVSMSFNYLGYPVGSALSGLLASQSIAAAVLFSSVTSVAAAAFVALIPQRAD